MSEIVTAIYENGILRPMHPLNLREKQRVRIQVWTEETPVKVGSKHVTIKKRRVRIQVWTEERGDKVDRVIQELVENGLLSPPSGHPEGGPISAEERRELAETLGRTPGQPLSSIIIEERDKW